MIVSLLILVNSSKSLRTRLIIYIAILSIVKELKVILKSITSSILKLNVIFIKLREKVEGIEVI